MPSADAMSIRVLVPQRIVGPPPPSTARIARLGGRSMGCEWRVSCVDEGGRIDAAAAPAADQRLSQEICAVLDRVVEQMSTWEPDSLITRFNRAATGSRVELPSEFALVLGCALHVARATCGALDPTAGELVRLWGFGPSRRYHDAGFVIPDSGQIKTALACRGWQRLQLDAAMDLLQPGGLTLDFSAVAKGFAVDEVSRLLRAQGFVHHLVDIGGELRGAGMKPDGQPWWVDVQSPIAGATPTRIALHELAVATSGDYLQGFDVDGRRYSHCIDPRSGCPVDNGVCSVTVVHSQCMLADAWSTALMVLGVEDGLAVAAAENIAALWVVRAGDGIEEHASSAFRALIA